MRVQHPILPLNGMTINQTAQAVVIAVTDAGFSYGEYRNEAGARAALEYAIKVRGVNYAQLWTREGVDEWQSRQITLLIA